MTAGPKGVAGRPDSLPAQQIAADPLQSYCPDLDQWPASWAYEACDIPHGLRIVRMLQAVPARDAGHGSVAQDLAPAPRQHLGPWR